MENNLKYYDALAQPPPSALRSISGGRIGGKTDINPQWRYKAMTEQFGPIGIGWKYAIDRLWLEPADNGQVCAFSQINVWILVRDEWSEAIPGIGGSMMTEMERNGLHVSDECFKMATTDALSVALKMVGVAADIYAGHWDGSKYKNKPPETPPEATKSKSEGDKAVTKATVFDGKAFGLKLERLSEEVPDIWAIDKVKFLLKQMGGKGEKVVELLKSLKPVPFQEFVESVDLAIKNLEGEE